MFIIKLTTQVGLILTNKTDHLFRSFGISNQVADRNNKGVLASEIEKGSVAENYGRQQGDLIIGANKIRIQNLTE